MDRHLHLLGPLAGHHTPRIPHGDCCGAGVTADDLYCWLPRDGHRARAVPGVVSLRMTHDALGPVRRAPAPLPRANSSPIQLAGGRLQDSCNLRFEAILLASGFGRAHCGPRYRGWAPGSRSGPGPAHIGHPPARGRPGRRESAGPRALRRPGPANPLMLLVFDSHN
jgi:hypothetical protein